MKEALKKLPETWHVVVTEENKETIKSYFVGLRKYDIGSAFGMINGEFRSRIPGFIYDMGQEITFTDFKRLVLDEKKDNEIATVKTWETVYFKTEKARVELTLNHRLKTFDLQTESEEMVSFKKDSIDVARERLKCIESALDYVEKYL